MGESSDTKQDKMLEALRRFGFLANCLGCPFEGDPDYNKKCSDWEGTPGFIFPDFGPQHDDFSEMMDFFGMSDLENETYSDPLTGHPMHQTSKSPDKSNGDRDPALILANSEKAGMQAGKEVQVNYLMNEVERLTKQLEAANQEIDSMKEEELENAKNYYNSLDHYRHKSEEGKNKYAMAKLEIESLQNHFSRLRKVVESKDVTANILKEDLSATRIALGDNVREQAEMREEIEFALCVISQNENPSKQELAATIEEIIEILSREDD